MKNQQTYIYISFWKILEATLKSKQPFTLPYILSPPLQHVTYLNHQDISNQPNELVCHRLSLSCLLYF